MRLSKKTTFLSGFSKKGFSRIVRAQVSDFHGHVFLARRGYPVVWSRLCDDWL